MIIHEFNKYDKKLRIREVKVKIELMITNLEIFGHEFFIFMTKDNKKGLMYKDDFFNRLVVIIEY